MKGFLPIRVLHPNHDVVGGIIAVAVKKRGGKMDLIYRSSSTGRKDADAKIIVGLIRGVALNCSFRARLRLAWDLIASRKGVDNARLQLRHQTDCG